MPKFHFYLVSANGREHVGSIELPSQNDLIPAGLRFTTKILATIVTAFRARRADGAVRR